MFLKDFGLVALVSRLYCASCCAVGCGISHGRVVLAEDNAVAECAADSPAIEAGLDSDAMAK